MRWLQRAEIAGPKDTGMILMSERPRFARLGRRCAPTPLPGTGDTPCDLVPPHRTATTTAGGTKLSEAGPSVVLMMHTDWVDDLDAPAAMTALEQVHHARLEAEAQEFRLAAHWADLHNGDAADGTRRPLPGMERSKQVGGHGTPPVREFAAAELAAVLGVSPVSGQCLVRDALDVRHRHPRLWAAVMAGEARVWQARQIAQACHRAALTLDQTLAVDAETTPLLGTLPWSRFSTVLEGRIVAADPQRADARRLAAEADRFVATGTCNQFGLKTLIAKATAGDVIWLDAMCDRIAAMLAVLGDEDTLQVRRSKALGLLGHPVKVLALFAEYDDAVRDGRVEPVDAPEDDERPTPEPSGAPAPAEPSGDPALFVKLDLDRLDWRNLLPRITLYVHLSEENLTRDATGVARIEGLGPITVEQLREFLRDSRQPITVKPVIDLADRRPADGYETPPATAEALHLRTPADAFPYAGNLTLDKDKDHVRPYRPPDSGGPPGQTNLDNLAPMIRFHHRIKTHGRWQVRQPEANVYLWRTPHGRYFRVDAAGTHRLPQRTGELAWLAAARGDQPESPLEAALGRLVDAA